MITYILSLILFLLPPENQPIQVDVTEINHKYSNDGTLTFTQVIYWDYYPCCGTHHVVAWRMYKSIQQYPRHHAHPTYPYISYCSYHQTHIISRSKRETWTQYDPEIDDRRKLPEHQRRGLRKQR